MSARGKLFAVAALAGACGCSRPGAGTASGPGIPETRVFLQQVVAVRAQMSADDTDRLPAMIRSGDSAAMTDEIVKIGQYRLALRKLNPSRVDAKVVRLQQGMEAVLDAFRFACLDAAELFRETKEFDSKQADRPPLAPALLSALRRPQANTVDSLESALQAFEDLDTSAGGGMDINPIINSVRADQARLKQALDAEQELAKQVSMPAGN